MTNVNSCCLPTIGAGGERGVIEGSERARCGFSSYLAVIGILPCPIVHHEAFLRSRLTQYSKQQDLVHPRIGTRRYPQQLLYNIYNTPFWLELSQIKDAGSTVF